MNEETPQNLETSSIEEVRAKTKEFREGKLVKLPSGLVFRITRPSMSRLLRDGKFPSKLLSTAMNMSGGATPGSMSAESIKQSIQMMDVMVVEAVVEPKIVLENPTDAELGIDELHDSDKTFIFNYVQTGATALENFRDRGVGTDSGSNLQKVSGDKAKPVPSSKRSLDSVPA